MIMQGHRKSMLLRRISVSFLTVIAVIWLPVSGLAQTSRVPLNTASISQLVENREGRISCWGIIIQLGNLRFRNRISPNQIMIREAKHGHDLRRIMEWHVDRNGRRLTIRFKPGMGDFGSGNAVEVEIQRSAFTDQVSSGNNHFRWSINTDVL